jgi:GNAT superfamily N-acetyltransferase
MSNDKITEAAAAAPEAIIAIEIRREPLESAVVTALIQELNTELTARYPEEGATHFTLQAAEVTGDRGAFLVAYAGQTPIGCGAIRRLDGGEAEVKRMYVVPAQRGNGIGRAILTALEAESRRLGVTRLLLETGIRQTVAQSLYAQAGFKPIPAYGEYIGCPLSVCMAKTL